MADTMRPDPFSPVLSLSADERARLAEVRDLNVRVQDILDRLQITTDAMREMLSEAAS